MTNVKLENFNVVPDAVEDDEPLRAQWEPGSGVEAGTVDVIIVRGKCAATWEQRTVVIKRKIRYWEEAQLRELPREFGFKKLVGERGRGMEFGFVVRSQCTIAPAPLVGFWEVC